MKSTNPIWSERYRPSAVADLILPTTIYSLLKQIVEKGSCPNLLMSGPPGVGKTTAALALASEMGMDTYLINGSLKGNIDTLRTEISDFCSTVSLTGARKMVIIDEADYLNPQSFQPAFRNFMEEHSGNVSFVLTCNYPARIIDPLKSRCSHVEFSWSKDDKVEMARAFHARCMSILSQEGIEADAASVGELVRRHFPDWRRVLNELQRYASHGKIDSGILARRSDDLTELVRAMAKKDFTTVRKWVAENAGSDSVKIMRDLYDKAYDFLAPASVPQMVLAVAEHQYRAAHVADQEVNMASLMVTIMASCSFKEGL